MDENVCEMAERIFHSTPWWCNTCICNHYYTCHLNNTPPYLACGINKKRQHHYEKNMNFYYLNRQQNCFLVNTKKSIERQYTWMCNKRYQHILEIVLLSMILPLSISLQCMHEHFSISQLLSFNILLIYFSLSRDKERNSLSIDR